jgi:hypothetical protein
LRQISYFFGYAITFLGKIDAVFAKAIFNHVIFWRSCIIFLPTKIIHTNNMTYKEILERCNFKDIAPYITKYYPKEAWALTHFKEVFDIFRHLEPDTNTENNTIEIVKCYDEFNKVKYLRTSGGGDFWTKNLAKEVVFEEELSLSDCEIVAHCLWEFFIFFFPYNYEEWDRAVMRIEGIIDTSNPYTVAADKLRRKQTDNYLPKKYKGEEYLPEEIFMKSLFSPTPKNRLKRMRDHRQDKRIKVLERKAKVENAIRTLIKDTDSFTRDDVKYLFNTKLISQRTLRSRSYNLHNRIDYLINSFSNFVSDNFFEYTHFILMFRTSAIYLLNHNEKDMIENFFIQRLPAIAHIRFGYGTNEHLDTEVSLFFLCSY